MRNFKAGNLEFSSAMLSIFDVNGSFLTSTNPWQVKGLQYDTSQLANDQNHLKQDYRTAYEKTAKALVNPDDSS